MLNEAHEKLDAMVDKLHVMVEESRRPRTYRRVLRKKCLAMAKAKKCPAKKMRSLVRVLLCAVKRNMVFVDAYLAKVLILVEKRDRWSRERTGHYPKRVLVDQVYRTKENCKYYERRGVKMSGCKPGRLPADKKERRRAERAERKDEIDRIEVERFFSRDKRCFGAGLVMDKFSKTTLVSIALSVLVANLFDAGLSVLVFYFAEAADGVPAVHLMEVLDDAA